MADHIIKDDYSVANSILASKGSADTPELVTLAINQLIGRAGSNIQNLTAAEVIAILNALTANIVDAKGDILAATADNTIAKLTVGTDDYVLVADSGEATGLKWAPSTGVVAMQVSLGGKPYVANDIILVRAPRAFTLSKIRIGLGIRATGSSITVDITYSAASPPTASSIFAATPANRPVLTTSDYTADSGAPDTTAIADGGFFYVCILGADSNNIAENLTIEFLE